MRLLLSSLALATLLWSSAPAAEQVIVPGNVLNFTVLGYPELSRTVLVRQDGSTEYPLLYNIPIDGMTVTELHELLIPILTRYVERPYLFINISEYLQLQVTVQGQVAHPGMMAVQGPTDLQAVLASAGGATPKADLSHITILRREGDRRREMTVNLYKFLQDRESQPLPEISNGDIIYVPTLTSQTMVRVMGAVQQPGSYLAVQGENIADMIYQAGGPNSKGNLNNILHITMGEDGYQSSLVKLTDLLSRGEPGKIPRVQKGDIIIVREYSSWQRFSWWLQLIRDATLLASTAVILSRL